MKSVPGIVGTTSTAARGTAPGTDGETTAIVAGPVTNIGSGNRWEPVPSHTVPGFPTVGGNRTGTDPLCSCGHEREVHAETRDGNRGFCIKCICLHWRRPKGDDS